jgi:hypothetical protein
MGIEPLTKAYEATPVGLDSWVKQAVRHITIVELRHEVRSRRAHINTLRFRRLR